MDLLCPFPKNACEDECRSSIENLKKEWHKDCGVATDYCSHPSLHCKSNSSKEAHNIFKNTFWLNGKNVIKYESSIAIKTG